MQPGCFYCFIPKKGAVSAWLPFYKNNQRGVFRRINAVLRHERASGVETGILDESDLFHCTQQNNETLSLVYPGAGLTVRSGVVELTSHVSRSEPNVYSTEKAFIVLRGYLSNIEDLCLRMGRLATSVKSLFIDTVGGHGLTTGEVAAKLILMLYLSDKGKDPLLVLSELQGHYAFVIYDSEDKRVFAARDASGKQPLYYAADRERDIALSNIPLAPAIDGMEESTGWMEIPPGYYLYGRQPQLQQFALTADQLTARWSMDLEDEAELYSSMDSAAEQEHRRSWSLGLTGSTRHRFSSRRTPSVIAGSSP